MSSRAHQAHQSEAGQPLKIRPPHRYGPRLDEQVREMIRVRQDGRRENSDAATRGQVRRGRTRRIVDSEEDEADECSAFQQSDSEDSDIAVQDATERRRRIRGPLAQLAAVDDDEEYHDQQTSAVSTKNTGRSRARRPVPADQLCFIPRHIQHGPMLQDKKKKMASSNQTRAEGADGYLRLAGGEHQSQQVSDNMDIDPPWDMRSLFSAPVSPDSPKTASDDVDHGPPRLPSAASLREVSSHTAASTGKVRSSSASRVRKGSLSQGGATAPVSSSIRPLAKAATFSNIPPSRSSRVTRQQPFEDSIRDDDLMSDTQSPSAKRLVSKSTLTRRMNSSQDPGTSSPVPRANTVDHPKSPKAKRRVHKPERSRTENAGAPASNADSMDDKDYPRDKGLEGKSKPDEEEDQPLFSPLSSWANTFLQPANASDPSDSEENVPLSQIRLRKMIDRAMHGERSSNDTHGAFSSSPPEWTGHATSSPAQHSTNARLDRIEKQLAAILQSQASKEKQADKDEAVKSLEEELVRAFQGNDPEISMSVVEDEPPTSRHRSTAMPVATPGQIKQESKEYIVLSDDDDDDDCQVTASLPAQARGAPKRQAIESPAATRVRHPGHMGIQTSDARSSSTVSIVRPEPWSLSPQPASQAMASDIGTVGSRLAQDPPFVLDTAPNAGLGLGMHQSGSSMAPQDRNTVQLGQPAWTQANQTPTGTSAGDATWAYPSGNLAQAPSGQPNSTMSQSSGAWGLQPTYAPQNYFFFNGTGYVPYAASYTGGLMPGVTWQANGLWNQTPAQASPTSAQSNSNPFAPLPNYQNQQPAATSDTSAGPSVWPGYTDAASSSVPAWPTQYPALPPVTFSTQAASVPSTSGGTTASPSEADEFVWSVEAIENYLASPEGAALMRSLPGGAEPGVNRGGGGGSSTTQGQTARSDQSGRPGGANNAPTFPDKGPRSQWWFPRS